MAQVNAIEKHLDHFLQSRAPPKSFCPSEVARSLSSAELRAEDVEDWRDIMPRVRQIAEGQRLRGELEVLQKGIVIDSETAIEDIKGPIRMRRVVPG